MKTTSGFSFNSVSGSASNIARGVADGPVILGDTATTRQGAASLGGENFSANPGPTNMAVLAVTVFDGYDFCSLAAYSGPKVMPPSSKVFFGADAASAAGLLGSTTAAGGGAGAAGVTAGVGGGGVFGALAGAATTGGATAGAAAVTTIFRPSKKASHSTSGMTNCATTDAADAGTVMLSFNSCHSGFCGCGINEMLWIVLPRASLALINRRGRAHDRSAMGV